MRPSGNDKAWRWAALILGTVVLGIGCNPLTLCSFLLPWGEDKEPPQVMKLAASGKEVNVVVLAQFATPQLLPELIGADRELSERVAYYLGKRFAENKERVKLVPPAKVHNYLRERLDWDKHQIGKDFKADYVVFLEIQRLTLRENSQLYHGNAEIDVTLIDVHQPRGEAAVHRETYRCQYPSDTEIPKEVSEIPVGKFREDFLNRIGKDIRRYFTSYPRSERHARD